jgi:hypothetical protein
MTHPLPPSHAAHGRGRIYCTTVPRVADASASLPGATIYRPSGAQSRPAKRRLARRGLDPMLGTLLRSEAMERGAEVGKGGKTEGKERGFFPPFRTFSHLFRAFPTFSHLIFPSGAWPSGAWNRHGRWSAGVRESWAEVIKPTVFARSATGSYRINFDFYRLLPPLTG